MTSSYDSMFKLGNDEVFQGRVRVCAYNECQTHLDDPNRADWSNLAYDTLRGADHVMDSFVRWTARTQEVADAAGDPPDQSLVTDEQILTAVDECYPLIASLFYNPDGTPWGGAMHPPVTPPAVTSCAPTSGPTGTVVTITGEGLSGATAVTIGTPCLFVTVVDDATVTAEIAETTEGSYDVVVTAADGLDYTCPDQFTVVAVPPPTAEITGFTPNHGGNGTVVTVTGSNLTATSAIVISQPVTGLTVVDDTQVRGTIVTGIAKGFYDVVVTVEGVDYVAPGGQFEKT